VVNSAIGKSILYGDCLQLLPQLPYARTIFADPPDNLRQKYGGFKDFRANYIEWLCRVADAALAHEPAVFWLSLYHKHLVPFLQNYGTTWNPRLFIWRFTFGQHQQCDCGNGYRSILRFSRPKVTWNTDAIRVPSARQTVYHDRRADSRGRVPDDVWEFPRVCGTFKEKRDTSPNQHPEALMERIVRMSGGPVIDLFGGTFTTDRVCRRLGVLCTSIEIRLAACRAYDKELARSSKENT
jgi:DNA modification methylase